MERILGQERAIDVLQKSLASGRVHHAWIFFGPEGVGKFTTATAFAKVLLCHAPQRDLVGRVTACDSCQSCRLLSRSDAAAAHPDYHVVTKELARYSDERSTRERKLMTIPVDVIRNELIEPVYRTAQLIPPGSTTPARKVFIVDEAHLLDRHGQNALLKTLEEPPAGSHIILVTPQRDRLLPTILSRCQSVAFATLKDDVVRDFLDRQHPDLSDEGRASVIELASGSLGVAAMAVEYRLSPWVRLVRSAVDGMAGGRFPVTFGADMRQMMEDFAAEWVKRHDNASKEAANKMAHALMCSLLTNYADRKLTGAAHQYAAQRFDVDEAQRATEPWIGVIEAVRESEGYIASNVNMGLLSDHLVTRMHRSLAVLAR
ncbi:MAG: hypothetical protein GC164_03655 [Phycisphaera sp.]|nr:hypothetical protein [Phycisphaera sp.]